MQLTQVISTANLTLAWRRIGTGKNYQHKGIFRDLYAAYEGGSHDNLRRLHLRLKGNWKATPPERIYLPKPSGLQRPLSLLHIEDQIVQQAVANIFAARLLARRRVVESRSVFSNALSKESGSIFFLQPWQRNYRRFQATCRKHFHSGFRWIGSFDLAAFYDTISHDLLVRVASPRSFHGDGAQKVLEWLECWSQGAGVTPFRHGIPQGPIASDFLAEAFLLPLDEALSKDGIRYVRYVDDIRIFAKTRIDAQRAAIRLEVLCRQLGLIPQGKKFLIIEAQSLDEVLGQLPSLTPQGVTSDGAGATLSAEDAESLLRQAMSGRPQRVTDKSKLRFALYRAPRSRRILGIVLRLLVRYPEHIDAFLAFLRLYSGGRSIEKALKEALTVMPNEYVRGELWRYAAAVATPDLARRLGPLARKDLADSSRPFWQRTGALIFLLRAEALGIGKAAGRLQYMPVLAQALAVPHLGDTHFVKSGTITKLLTSKSFEVSMPLGARLIERRLSHRDYGVKVSTMAVETQSVFRNLGLVGRRVGTTIDEVGEILSSRFGMSRSSAWKRILGAEYVHALQLLLQADAAFDSAPSLWLQNLNSFNDALARNVIARLAAAALPGGSRTVGKNGELVKLGSLLQVSGQFDTAHPVVARGFRMANDRRNHLPLAHPYDQKTGKRNHHLNRTGQRDLVKHLSPAYRGMLVIISGLP